MEEHPDNSELKHCDVDVPGPPVNQTTVPKLEEGVSASKNLEMNVVEAWMRDQDQ